MKRFLVTQIKRIAAACIGRYFTRSEYLKLTRALHPDLLVLEPPPAYRQDRLYTYHNCDFIQEPQFAQAYRLGKGTGSWGESDLQWRAYVACYLAERCSRLEGDFVECGVNRGGLSRAIIDFVDFPSRGKTFYLFDTFEGLVERYISEDEKRQGVVPGGYTECYEAVQKNFVGLPVQIIRGAVPETLNQVSIGKVAYLSIDMNCTAPEIAAAEFFWDKLVPGGFVLLDDYGWEGHIEQKKAFDEFARQRGTRVLCLPTGQGVLFKD